MSDRPQGRPSKYKPEYDQMLIDHMASGLSYLSFAGEIGVCEDTLFEWEKHHVSFSESKKIGFAKNRTWWEKMGNAHITHVDSKFESSPKLNSTVFIFNMKNRFPREWRDRVEVSGDKEAPLNLTLNYERKKKPSND
jgi:hypothetical protein